MCLAVPARIERLHPNKMATVDLSGVRRQVSVELLDEVQEGEWVAVHVGFAIARLDEQEARETLELLRQVAELADLPPAEEEPPPGLPRPAGPAAAKGASGP
ncbi:MAG: HypC/HybG/HupF family hydrogenase formation chaperone [Limnochordaceae bacterium]|nr:HypC/HybG/HupF family hydrogenase formation chaperone [Limnochordaceae bacterium]